MGMERSEKENHDYLLGHANVSSADNLLKQHSAFYLFLKDMYGRVRFKDVTGENIVEKAQEEEVLTALNMIVNPEHPKVIKEWENNLVLMRKMTNLAKERGIPFILIATPLDFQLGHEKEFAHPQRILKKFSEEEGIEFIDLLETLHRLFAESIVGEPVETTEEIDRIIRETDIGSSDPFADFWAIYFLEYIHPSIKGNELIVSLLKPVVLNALDTTDPS
jgi:lysophospholipase L1-like esterase